MSTTRVLVVDDQEIVARALSAMVRSFGHDVTSCHSVEQALAAFDTQPFDAVLSDVKMGALGGFDLLRGVHERAPTVPVVLITGEASVSAAMDAIAAGAYDYVGKPPRAEALGGLLARAIEHKRALAHERGAAPPEPPAPGLPDIVGRSPEMLEVFKKVARIAPGDANVLVLGENGTGKEMVARALHEKSHRADKAFVAVNASAITPGVAESELFGHRRGAFTDAREHHKGLFEIADGGTLFLDEIGDLDLALQVKLLRAIQEKKVRPVGAADEVPADVRLVSATNQDLRRRVDEGRFRRDLYFRINVVEISLPPLRERREDIPTLANYFLARYAGRIGRPVPVLAESTLALLLADPWEGNVRELENAMQHAVQFCTSGVVTPDLLPPPRSPAAASAPGAGARPRAPGAFETLREHTQEYVREVLEFTHGNVTQAARILGVSRRTLQRMSGRAQRAGADGDKMSHGLRD